MMWNYMLRDSRKLTNWTEQNISNETEEKSGKTELDRKIMPLMCVEI